MATADADQFVIAVFTADTSAAGDSSADDADTTEGGAEVDRETSEGGSAGEPQSR